LLSFTLPLKTAPRRNAVLLIATLQIVKACTSTHRSGFQAQIKSDLPTAASHPTQNKTNRRVEMKWNESNDYRRRVSSPNPIWTNPRTNYTRHLRRIATTSPLHRPLDCVQFGSHNQLRGAARACQSPNKMIFDTFPQSEQVNQQTLHGSAVSRQEPLSRSRAEAHSSSDRTKPMTVPTASWAARTSQTGSVVSSLVGRAPSVKHPSLAPWDDAPADYPPLVSWM